MGIRRAGCLVSAYFLALAGCGVVGRTSVELPAVDFGKAADEAVDRYDKNADGSLSESELVACPGLRSAFTQYDTSGDKQLSREEISERLNAMYSQGTGLMPFDCRVTLDNRALVGAEVRLVPEEFLGVEVKAGTGVSDATGMATVGIADEDLPEKLRGRKVMQMGVYRVEITHPSVKISAKYNAQTTLGHEIGLVDPGQPVVFHLRSR